MSQPFRIALAGLGTVGTGLLELITEYSDELKHRYNREWQVVSLCAKNKNKHLKILKNFPSAIWENEPLNILNHKPDVVVELIGGSKDPALSLTVKALQNAIPVVTANKALIAEHGYYLAEMAEKNSTSLCFEAGVAGALPVVKLLRESLSANHINRIVGILNGTCNYILSTMESSKGSFKNVLNTAQKLGYAEIDPSCDINGIDSARKLAILTTIAFGIRCNINDIPYTGITDISDKDIEAADNLGYVFRLICRATEIKKALSVEVSPMLVKKGTSLAATKKEANALEVFGDFSGPIFLVGNGAGAHPTASAVAADLSAVARSRTGPPFGIPLQKLRKANINKHNYVEFHEEWYMRLNVQNKKGVLANISSILRDNDISIHSAQQVSSSQVSVPVDLVFRLHKTSKAQISSVSKTLNSIPSVQSPVSVFPILV